MLLGKSEGFFLVELLMALMIWMLIAATCIPIYLKVSKQSISIQKEKEALQILHEELLANKKKYGPYENKTITRGNKEFKITWAMDSGFPKVCVYFEHMDKEVEKKCKYAE